MQWGVTISLDLLYFGGVVKKKMRFACQNFENVNISYFESALATSIQHQKIEFQRRKDFSFMDLFLPIWH